MNCEKCGGTGQYPLVKNGKVIPHTVVFCDCHPIYGDNAHYNVPVATEGKRPPSRGKIPSGRLHLYQDDFDFPMSYSFYRSLCLQHGWSDPGSDYPELENLLPVETERKVELLRYYSYQNVDGKQLSELRKNLTSYIDKKIKEILESKKVDKQYTKYIIK